jgi:alpha-L-rhamnosidase
MLLAVIVTPASAAPSAPTSLRTDDVNNPVGTEAAPYFGWLDNETNPNEVQSAYEILVASSPAKLDANQADVWDTGKISSDQENHIVYAGPPLTSDSQYFWKVLTWDREGNPGPYSPDATFTVGLLANSDWTAASWIKRDTNAPDDYTFYRKSAPLPAGTIDRATVYVTSVHKYTLYINGTLVGKGPAYAFPAYQFYNAFDITPLIKPGAPNQFAIFNHWFGGGSGRPPSSRGVLMEAIIHYADGSRALVGTDGTWLQTQATSWVTGQPRRNGQGGCYVEKIDARNLTPNWPTLGFDDSAWKPPTVIGPQPNPIWTGTPIPDLARIVETPLKPVSITNVNGNYIVDMGKVYSGTPRISFSNGTAGATVNMLGGFALLPTGEIDNSQNQMTTLTYYAVLSGSDFTFEPAEYNQMRYFEIFNSPMPVTADNFSFIERHSQMNDAASSFTSSNTTLNNVWDLMKHSLPVGAQEEFIDSMRQKGGFLGDGFQQSLVAMPVENERVLTHRQLGEFVRSMTQFWSTGPNIGRVNACYPDVNNARDIPDYTQAFLQWVWEYYLQTGDRAFLANNYTALTNIAQYVNRSLNPTTGLITRLLGGTSASYRNGIIDWPADMRFGYDMSTVTGPGNSASTVINAWAWEDYDIMSRIAADLGKTDDQTTYRKMADDLQKAINTNILNSKGLYVDGLDPDGTQSKHASQHANASLLALGIVPPAQQPTVTAQVDSLGMSVSALGILPLVRALGESNQGPQLIDLYTNPNQFGWAKILSLGGTATWESWTANTDGDSESHGWSAVGLDGFIRYILGLKPLAPQFAQVQIMPLDFGPALTSVSGSLLTDRGTITIKWDRTLIQFHLAVTIPTNITATVYVPQAGNTDTSVTVDGAKLPGTPTNGYIGIPNIGSGTHDIQRVIESPK